MMNILKKLFVIVLLTSLVMMFVPVISNAGAAATTSMTSTFKGNTNTDSDNVIQNVIKGVLGVTRIIAAAVAVIILLVLGIKYMLASAGDKADIKKYAINYIIGAIIVFAAPRILTIIIDIVNGAVTVAAGS